VALLYAPASGQVTRRRLAQRARQLRRVAVRRIGQTGRALSSQAERVRDAAGEWIAGHMPQGNGKQAARRPVRHAHVH
jgi:gas vesicle protein